MNEAKMTELTQAEEMACFRADLCRSGVGSPEWWWGVLVGEGDPHEDRLSISAFRHRRHRQPASQGRLSRLSALPASAVG